MSSVRAGRGADVDGCGRPDISPDAVRAVTARSLLRPTATMHPYFSRHAQRAGSRAADGEAHGGPDTSRGILGAVTARSLLRPTGLLVALQMGFDKPKILVDVTRNSREDVGCVSVTECIDVINRFAYGCRK
jgi:hypothetical protein